MVLNGGNHFNHHSASFPRRAERPNLFWVRERLDRVQIAHLRRGELLHRESKVCFGIPVDSHHSNLVFFFFLNLIFFLYFTERNFGLIVALIFCPSKFLSIFCTNFFFLVHLRISLSHWDFVLIFVLILWQI